MIPVGLLSLAAGLSLRLRYPRNFYAPALIVEGALFLVVGVFL